MDRSQKVKTGDRKYSILHLIHPWCNMRPFQRRSLPRDLLVTDLLDVDDGGGDECA
jgi:hypothetical protein